MAQATDDNIMVQIASLMDFYLSDANLSWDSFLTRLIVQHEDTGFIPLHEFTSFNKLKALSTDVSLIADAIQLYSKDLKLSQDKQGVTRIQPFENKKNETDQCTVYIERFPPKSTVESLKNLFESVGDVAMVRIPKKKDGQHQPFGFVEFKNSSSVPLAVEKFNLFLEEKQKALDALFVCPQQPKDSHFDKESKKNQLCMRVMPKVEWTRLKKEYMKWKEFQELEGKYYKMEQKLKKVSEEAQKKLEFTRKSSLRVQGINVTSSSKDIQDYFSKFGEILYVEYKEGSSWSNIIFSTSEEAAETHRSIAEAISKGEKSSIGLLSKVTRLHGKDEVALWERIEASEAKHRRRALKIKRQEEPSTVSLEELPPQPKHKKFDDSEEETKERKRSLKDDEISNSIKKIKQEK